MSGNPLPELGPQVVQWLSTIDNPATLGGRPERLLEAAEAAGVVLDVTEAAELAAWLSTLGPHERLGRWCG